MVLDKFLSGPLVDGDDDDDKEEGEELKSLIAFLEDYVPSALQSTGRFSSVTRGLPWWRHLFPQGTGKYTNGFGGRTLGDVRRQVEQRLQANVRTVFEALPADLVFQCAWQLSISKHEFGWIVFVHMHARQPEAGTIVKRCFQDMLDATTSFLDRK
jgi:hypothetical protein